jgi:hypothetical protein
VKREGADFTPAYSPPAFLNKWRGEFFLVKEEEQ